VNENVTELAPEERASTRARHVLFNRWSLQLVLTVGLLAFAITRVDLGESLHAFENLELEWAIAALAILSGSKLVAAYRWRIYLRKVGEPPLAGLLGAYVIGSMINTLLPLRSGDFAKVQIVASRYRLPAAAISSSVFAVEAILDGLTLLLLFLLSLAFLNADFVPDLIAITFGATVSVGFLGVMIVSRVVPREMPRWSWLGSLPAALRTRLTRAWPPFLDGMWTLRDRKLFVPAFSLHVVEWLMRAALLGFVGTSLSLGVEAAVYVVLATALAVVTIFPVTFLNVGTYQVAVTEILAAYGLSRADAFAFAVTAHAISYAWILVMGVVALVLMQAKGLRG
jgi:uncharacterized protein (TIRG00374 family)